MLPSRSPTHASAGFSLLLALGLGLSLLPLRPAALAAPPDGTPQPTRLPAASLTRYDSGALQVAPPVSAAARRSGSLAVPGSVVINEVVTDPQTDWSSSGFDGAAGVGAITDSDEFVELYIKTAGLDLSGWTIELTDSSPTSGGLGAGGAFAVARYAGPGSPQSTAAGAYLVLGNANSGSLNNTLVIVLKDGDGQVIDQVQLGGDGAPSGDATGPDDEAIARVPNGLDTGSDLADFVQIAATPGAANLTGQLPPPADTATATATDSPTPTPTELGQASTSTASPTPSATPTPHGLGVPGVVLNELQPRGAEFIELYNPTGAAIDLTGWRLDDIAGGTSPYVLPPGTVIGPGGFLVFAQTVTGVGLNDDGDTARLLWPDDSVVDAVSYAKAPVVGFSLARMPDGGDWTERGLPTPGLPNQAAPLPESGTGSIGEFRHWPDGAWITAVGRVSVLPNTYSPRTIHLQDASGGLTVYLGRDDWPPLALGQAMQVLGYLRHRSGELQLYVRNGWHVHPGPADDLAPVPPVAVMTGEIGEGTEGRLVIVTGRVTAVDESALWLDDGSGPARVFFAAATGLPRPPAQVGQTWRVIGAVVEFTTTGASAPNFRLQPRAAADVAQIMAGLAVPYVPAGTATPTPEAPEATATMEP